MISPVGVRLIRDGETVKAIRNAVFPYEYRAPTRVASDMGTTTSLATALARVNDDVYVHTNDVTDDGFAVYRYDRTERRFPFPASSEISP